MDLPETQLFAQRLDVVRDSADAVVPVAGLPGSTDPALVEEHETMGPGERLHPREEISVGQGRTAVQEENRFSATNRTIVETDPRKGHGAFAQVRRRPLLPGLGSTSLSRLCSFLRIAFHFLALVFLAAFLGSEDAYAVPRPTHVRSAASLL